MITVYHLSGATNAIDKEEKEKTEKMKEDTSCSKTFGNLGFPFLGRYSLIHSVFRTCSYSCTINCTLSTSAEQ